LPRRAPPKEGRRVKQPLLPGLSPLLARVAPFLIFLGLTFLQGAFGETSRYWIYLAKTVLGAWMLWAVWGRVAECRWAFSWEAVVVGVGVCVLWVGLDPYYPGQADLLAKVGLGHGSDPAKPSIPWNPLAQFGSGSALAWVFIVVRILGSSLVVPPLEETFYRSFLYRYLANPKWEDVPLNRWNPMAFFVTAFVFGFAHSEWLAGILCGMAYQWLVLRKNRLGDAMTAHAITNFLLGLWVVGKGAWNFW
jgi:CAAX prenyl protease-like protein